MTRELIYLSCPYSHTEEAVRQKRHFLATFVTFQLLSKGLLVYSPLTHNIPIKKMGFKGNFEAWQHFDLAMLERSNKLIILKLPGWEESEGCRQEIEHAKRLKIPVEEMEPPLEPTSETSHDGLHALLARMHKIYDEREWEQFHSPKNLAMDLGSEIGEILDIFRYATEAESRNPTAKIREKAREEIGDAFLVLLHLAEKLNIDPLEAAHRTLEKIEKKYPAEQSRGKSLKYTEYT